MSENYGKLSALSQKVLLDYPVRKGREEKQAFRTEAAAGLKALGWNVQEETGGKLVRSVNLVAGDVQKARLVLTAHYDTPARMPFPNFLAPRNLFFSILYMLLVGGVVFLVMFGAAFLLRSLGAPPLLRSAAMLVVALGIIIMLLVGPDNPSNINDNTSGVVTLLEVAETLPKALRSQVALVFFDNEELGLLGSAAFRRAHGGLEDKLLLNFDCVGVGSTLLFVLPGAVRRDAETLEALRASFPEKEAEATQRGAQMNTSALTLYPSDQMMFPRGVGVVALKRAPVVGLYLSRIHTARDTELEEENILLLRAGAAKLAAALAPAAKDKKGGPATG